MSEKRCFSVEPSWPIDCCEVVFTAASFTDERYLSFAQMWKDISRMTQYWRLLWGKKANGETLNVGKSLSLIVLYLMIFEKCSAPWSEILIRGRF